MGCEYPLHVFFCYTDAALGTTHYSRCILKAQEVTAKGVHQLPHAIYCCN